jgi:hypothetical protein
VMVFMAGMVDAVNEESALRGAIQKAMAEVGCVESAPCTSNSECGTNGAVCVSCGLLF